MTTSATGLVEPEVVSGSGVYESKVGYQWEFKQHPSGHLYMLTVTIGRLVMSRGYGKDICVEGLVSEAANIAWLLIESIMIKELNYPLGSIVEGRRQA